MISGLYASTDVKKAGKTLFQGRRLQDNHALFSRCLEVGRRYKIMNPDKMRTTYVEGERET